jgi:hypothetical protein
MRPVMVSAATVLAAVLGTAGVSLTASAAPAVSAATAPAASYNWLNGVSCLSAKDCVAVGTKDSSSGYEPVAEQWNGKTWKTLTVKLPAGGADAQLFGVSCASGKCVAVGDFTVKGTSDLGLAETWNGASWSGVKVTEPPGASAFALLGVSCAAADHCVATGWYYRVADHQITPLAETWNGRSWTDATPPVPAGTTRSLLDGVSCASATRCVAVGQSGSAAAGDTASVVLTDYWNGTAWKRVTAPGPGKSPILNSVSCSSAARCVAVGNSPSIGEALAADVTFADTWNGARWTETVLPKPTRSGQLSGLACASAAKCLTVGEAFTSAAFANTKAYAVALNGTRWSLTKTPATPSADDSQFRAVTCTSATACIAVGLESLETMAAPYSTAARWNGSTWTTVNPPR